MASNTTALIVPPTNAPAMSAVETKDIRDIKPPLPIPNYWLWLWAGIALLLLAVAAYTAWRIQAKKRSHVPPVPLVPAHVRAKERLQRALAHLMDPKRFCTEVSDALRVYLEERFQFHAPDRTTEEFLDELNATSLLMPDQKASLGEFLGRCDLVKFARDEPTENELRQLHDSALRLVDETQFERVSTAPSLAASS